jgi:hypothetical protein
VAGATTVSPRKSGKAFCIKAGGTGGVDTLSSSEQADPADNLIYIGEVVWGTNVEVKILG